MLANKAQIAFILLQFIGFVITDDNVLCITGDKDALTIEKGKRCVLSAWTKSHKDCNFDDLKLETSSESSIGVSIGVMQDEGGYYEVVVYCETSFCTTKDFQGLKDTMSTVTVSNAACSEKFFKSLESAWKSKWQAAFESVRYVSPKTTWEAKSQN